MNRPTPAIVAQDAVSPLPRAALWLLMLGYALPGFLGRSPWKEADLAAYGYMVEWAQHGLGWFRPTLLGQPPEFEAPLPYWLGAAAIRLLGDALGPELAVRLPFVGLLLLTMGCTWYAIYHLARQPQAQPVAFAFGGEAHPLDYARALADAGLLALIACLGLAQLSHEATPALAQLASAALSLFGLAALPARGARAGLALMAGTCSLALSGAPVVALCFGLAALWIAWQDHQAARSPDEDAASDTAAQRRTGPSVAWSAAALAGVSGLTVALDLASWQLVWPSAGRGWDAVLRGLVWFTWPAWPLVLWGLWRWKRHWRSRHLAIPLLLAGITVFSAVFTPAIERSLLVSLPALAALAALALPTFKRSLTALIDWFTLIFFSSCAVVIWVIWIATQTGVPAQPAANVARLAPLFVPSFSWPSFLPALVASVLWVWLVGWRAGRHRSALWKSLVLPAGGAALCWVLLMTLWLPMLDHARGFGVVIGQLRAALGNASCVQVHRLSRGEIAALLHQGGFTLEVASREARCPWLLVDVDEVGTLGQAIDPQQWTESRRVGWRASRRDDLMLFQRLAP